MSSQNGPQAPLRRLGPQRRASPARRRKTSNPVVSGGRWLVGHPWAIVGAVAAVWFVVWIIGTRSDPHHVKVAFPTAFNLRPGQDVAIDGLDAGKISKVEYADGRSVVELGIKDEYWPLPRGTVAISRYGTTIGSGTRRIDLKLGPADAPKIPDGGIIAAKDRRPAVDVDAVLNTASQATRQDAKNLTKNVDEAVTGSEQDANAGIAASGRGLKEIDGFLEDLGSDRVALSGLITNADRLMKVLASRSEQVSDLVAVSARTFEAFASRTGEIQQTLDGVQPAMREARTTLARVDGSLGGLTRLVEDIEPGAQRLKPLAKAATPALKNLSDIVPTALSTVRTTTKVAPELNTLLTNGTPFLGKAGRVAKELTPMVHCIRPYAPEIGGALAGHTGAYQEYFLATDPNPASARLLNAPPPWRQRKENGRHRVHDLRARINASTATLHAYPPGALSVEQFTKIGLKQYAFLRPPGLSAGQPQFMPECGITKDTLDPSKDPEEKFGR